MTTELTIDELKTIPVRDAASTCSFRSTRQFLDVIMHHRKSFHALSFGEEFPLCRFGMYEHYVGVSAASGIERLTRALR